MNSSPPLRLGTRASPLARWQAVWVAARLAELGQPVELVPITTSGDRDQTQPLGAIGGAGLFTKELQRALLEGRIDLAVHSLKDLPTLDVDGLCLAAIPARGPVADALVAAPGTTLRSLPPGARIGTGSLRRRAQLLHLRPDLTMLDVRGNVDTRLRKLRDGDCDALVLAQAGLERLGVAECVAEQLSPSTMLPAVGQGALGIETRSDDDRMRAALAPLDDRSTHACAAAERSLLASLRAGCLAPVGAWARHDAAGTTVSLSSVVLSGDGQRRLYEEATSAGDPRELGRRVAEALLAAGAAELIASARAF